MNIQMKPRSAKEQIRPPGCPSEIWRVAPAEFVIRSESPGNRECGARFRLIRDRCAKFEKANCLRFPSLMDWTNLTPRKVETPPFRPT
jgi:hypothetical protein